MRWRNLQRRDRLGRVHGLLGRKVFRNTSRNNYRNMPRVSRRSNFADRKFVELLLLLS
jgi:hypothetical protein